MKYNFIVLIILSVTFSFSQEKTSKIKTDKFEANINGLVRIEDYYLPDLIGLNDTLECNIRKIQISGDTKYYFQIVKKGKYDSKTATISENDLREIIEVIQVLNEKYNSENTLTKSDRQEAIDIISKDSLDLSIPYLPYYLENKYVIEDGFQIGYVSYNNILWFVQLERFGSNNIAMFDDYNYLKKTFEQALQKIEELKAGIIGDVEKFLQWKTKKDSLDLFIMTLFKIVTDSLRGLEEPIKIKLYKIGRIDNKRSNIIVKFTNQSGKNIKNAYAWAKIIGYDGKVLSNNKIYIIKEKEGGLINNHTDFYEYSVYVKSTDIDTVELYYANIEYY